MHAAIATGCAQHTGIEHTTHFSTQDVPRRMRTLRSRTKAQSLNHGTARWQYEAYRDGNLRYGVVYTKKPLEKRLPCRPPK